MNKDMVILIAEDNAGHFQLIKKNLWLTCVDNDILLFKDGQEILDFLFKNGSDIYPERARSQETQTSARCRLRIRPSSRPPCQTGH